MGSPELVNRGLGNHNLPYDTVRVQKLLEAGAEVNIKDARGKTTLHRASQARFTKIPNLLLQSGAGVNCADANGETLLFDAVRAGFFFTVTLLLHAGPTFT